MRRAYLPGLRTLEPGSRFAVPDALAHYLGRVLRSRVGDQLQLFDGEGWSAVAEVTHSSRHSLELSLCSRPSFAPPPALALTLAPALLAHDRFDWVVQKAVELGVSDVRPVWTERSEVRLDESRARRRQEHWQAIATDAARQCGRDHLPRIAAPAPLTEVLDLLPRPVLWARAGAPALNPAIQPPAVSLLIGPEGDYSERECAHLATLATAVGLGPRVLRAETAALVFTTVVQMHWGDLRGGE